MLSFAFIIDMFAVAAVYCLLMKIVCAYALKKGKDVGHSEYSFSLGVLALLYLSLGIPMFFNINLTLKVYWGLTALYWTVMHCVEQPDPERLYDDCEKAEKENKRLKEENAKLRSRLSDYEKKKDQE